MRFIFELGRFTSMEIMQSRAYRILLVLCAIIPFIALIFSNMFLVDLGKVFVDVLAGGAHFLATVFILFIATSLLSKDIDQRICYIMMKPPIDRWQFICGRFFGFAIAFLLLMSALALCGSIGAWLFLDANYSDYYSGLTLFSAPTLTFYIFFQYISLIGVLMFIFSWATGNAEIMVFTIAAAMFAWIFPPILHALQDPEIANQIPAWIQVLLSNIYSILPHLNGGDIALSLAHGVEIKPSESMAYFLEHISYAAAALILAILFFKRRDL